MLFSFLHVDLFSQKEIGNKLEKCDTTNKVYTCINCISDSLDNSSFCDTLSNLMNLLPPGNDSLIRIWIWGHERHEKNKIVDLNLSKKKISILYFDGLSNDSINSVVIKAVVTDFCSNITPTAGWTNFRKKIKEAKVWSLKKENEEKFKKVVLTGGAYVGFQFYAGGKNRFKRYFEPYQYKTVPI